MCGIENMEIALYYINLSHFLAVSFLLTCSEWFGLNVILVQEKFEFDVCIYCQNICRFIQII